MLSLLPTITIDGPTASGKGTIAQGVAERLGWHYLDSGALYRLTALACLWSQTDTSNTENVTTLAQGLACEFRGETIWLAGQEVTALIRQEAVGNLASVIAAYPGVRAALLQRQRAYRQPPGLVADGRDMGTVVFPDAVLKIFLTAAVAVRAERRLKQLKDKGISANLESLSRDLLVRDQRDLGRQNAPLMPANDALVLDSSQLQVNAVIDQVCQWYQARVAQPPPLSYPQL